MDIRLVAIMESGKTTAAINYIEHSGDMKFLFITPYLDEADRILQSCPSCKIKAPELYLTHGC